ncbi:MAG: efflux transporter outer membrane subunit [Planctomycetota bacterium]
MGRKQPLLHVLFTSLLIIFLSCLNGCHVGPTYEPPETVMPDQWHQTAVGGLADGSACLVTWWNVFEDPTLNELIDQAKAENLNLKNAYASVMEARALLGVASGESQLSLDATGLYSHDRASANGFTPTMGETDIFQVGLDATWEIDVFGRIGRTVESARAAMEASEENYRDVLVSLYSEVAQNYMDVRSLQARLRYAENNVNAQRETLELTKNRREAGLVPQLDVHQAELILAGTEATIPSLRQLESRAIHRVSVLVGKEPFALYEILSAGDEIPDVPEETIVGLPAELLRQRPDIRRAERTLASQTADIGVATAGLYPAFSLSGTFALQAQDFDDLGDWDSRVWGFGPAMRWNLFDGDRIRSSIKVQEAQAEQAMLQYEQTVLLALEDVENAMVAYVQEQQRYDSLQAAVVAGEKSVELVRTLYENGLTDFQNVLDMQRTLTVQQDQFAESEGQVAKNLVRLYTALGGGWNIEETESTDTSNQDQTD